MQSTKESASPLKGKRIAAVALLPRNDVGVGDGLPQPFTRLRNDMEADCRTPCGGLGGGPFNILNNKLGKRLTALAEFFSPFKV